MTICLMVLLALATALFPQSVAAQALPRAGFAICSDSLGCCPSVTPADTVAAPSPARPLLALKTNMLFDAALLLNGEVELALGRNNRWSVMAELWSPWYVWHHNSRAFELQVFGLEGRYWLGSNRTGKPLLSGLFVGAYYANGKYDLEWNSVGDQGEFNSAGATLGYCWPLRRRLNLELSGSLGFFRGPRRHYHGEYGDKHLIWKYTSTTSYVGPTKLKLSLVWMLGRQRAEAGKEVRP